MISIEEAIDKLRGSLPERRVEEVPLEDALDRVLASEVRATEPAPRYTNSAMDGYAVRWEDVELAAHGTPVRLRVVGESRAGVPFEGRVEPGQAVRISTGAMLPSGADTVVPVEDVSTQQDGTVVVRTADRMGRHVRYQGEDIAEGERLFSPGQRLTPNRIVPLAALGIHRVKVFARPRVAVLITGSELVDPGQEPKPWQIRDSNGVMLELIFQSLGAQVVDRRTVEDDVHATSRAISEAARSADVVVLTGGVSVGPHDHVKDAAERAGFEPVFWKVRQKPGKPLFYSLRENCRLFGLPGNPISSFVCALYYVVPMLRWLKGLDFGWDTERAVLTEPVMNRSERPTFFQGTVRATQSGVLELSPSVKQGSHILSSIADGNCFFLVPARSELGSGEQVEVILYPWR